MDWELEAAYKSIPLLDSHTNPDFHPSREEEDKEDVDIDGEDDKESVKILNKTMKSKGEQGIRFLGTCIPHICPQPRDENIGSR